MRVTTKSILRNYKTSLSKAASNREITRNRVLNNGQKFLTASEDTSSAVKAYRLRTEYSRNNDYLENVKTADKTLMAQEDAALEIQELAKQAQSDLLTAINGTSDADTMKTVATSFRGHIESIVQTLNIKFGDQYLFGGSNTGSPPLEYDSATGRLTYRGEDVSTGNMATLDEMSKESLYIDIGFGLYNNRGDLNDSTAFDTAASALNVLGYGKDADGDEGNYIMLLGQIADELERDPADVTKLSALSDKLQSNTDKILNFVTDLGTKETFLENTQDRLETNLTNINEKILNVENMDMAEAISEFVWAEYAYNAALKVGSSILSNSFIDFMQ